ncbi:mitogen-activated protein kinase kinase kinase [Microbotryomycetes sp. JL201]|nr:mitogen-activated protein kinase kinase kinase [Microbotryomycetes sp. JL201]
MSGSHRARPPPDSAAVRPLPAPQQHMKPTASSTTIASAGSFSPRLNTGSHSTYGPPAPSSSSPSYAPSQDWQMAYRQPELVRDSGGPYHREPSPGHQPLVSPSARSRKSSSPSPGTSTGASYPRHPGPPSHAASFSHRSITSPVSNSSSSTGVRSPASPPLQRRPLPEGAICMATVDHESLVVVPIGGKTSPEAIKESIFGKLHIADDDFFRFRLCRSSIGGDPGQVRALDDEQLWRECQSGDRQTVIYAKQIIANEDSAADIDLPAGMSAERMRQMVKDRAARDRDTDPRAGDTGLSSPTSSHSQQRKSPSLSSRSDKSTGAGEFGERADGQRYSGSLRSDRPSWIAHSRRESSGGGNNLTTPARDERVRHEGEYTSSPPLHSGSSPSPTFSFAKGQAQNQPSVVVGPSGPTRRLPPHPQIPNDGENDRYRAKTAPAGVFHPSSGGPPLRSVAAQPPPVAPRPLPPTDPRSTLPQYQPLVTQTGSTSAPVFHNIALQTSPYPSYQKSPSPHLGSQSTFASSNGKTLATPNTPMTSKSVDNLRGQYVQAPSDHDSRLGGQRPQPPQPPNMPYPGPASGFPQAFDPRVMNTPISHGTAATGSSAYYSSSLPQPPPLHPLVASRHSSQSSTPVPTPPQPPVDVWKLPQPPRRTSEQQQQSQQSQHHYYSNAQQSSWNAYTGLPQVGNTSQRMPDLSRPLNLKPGETLQSAAGQRPRRLSDVPPYKTGSGHSRVSDPISRDNLSPEVDTAQPSRFADGRRAASSSAAFGLSGVPKSLQPSRDRDSGSSFASARSDNSFSAGSIGASPAPERRLQEASAPPSDYEPGDYQGSSTTVKSSLQRQSRTQSPPSSARSSTTGPITPAQDQPPVVVQQLDEFGDPIDDDVGTWFPVNQPAGKLTEAASTMRRQMSEPGPTQFDEPKDGSGTARAHEWAHSMLERLGSVSLDGERTLTGRIRDQVEAATKDRPHTAQGLPKLDEFGDDPEEDSTYFPGFGPTKPTMPSESSGARSGGVSAPDAISSPSTDRGKRPNLRLQIEDHSPRRNGKADTARSGKRSVSPQAAASDVLASQRRAAAAGEPGDFSTHMSSRRLEFADKIWGSQSSGKNHSGMLLASPAPSRSSGRRNSFRAREDDNDWAIRPAVETVLENLDVYFPDVDLDKPVFELPSTPAPSTPSPSRETQVASSTLGSSGKDTSTTTSLPPPPRRSLPPAVSHSSAASNLGHKKSIRVVAQDRKRAMQKAGRNVVTAVSGIGSNLLRRKSTKLFGARIEEVTSAQMGRLTPGTIKEHPDDDPQNFSYKWIKGDLIGRGTFGHVYIGFSVNTGETIAVKQVELPKSQHDKEDQRIKGMVQSLKAEIELLKDLDHPNIVLYLGMEQTPEHLSIFLEYVPGGSIGRIVRTHGKFEEDVIKFFTVQILEGLEYLHSLGILHRDMKADNILTDHDGMCKISDFGTSKKSADIYNNNENMSMQGSIFWMAPEVIHNKNQGYSAKADIWSLGCILIEMWAGRRPWSDEEAIQAMFKLGAERLAPPVPPDVTLSELGAEFLHQCLEIDSDRRPKAHELKQHRFLELDDDWSFTETSLYKVMADEETRRRSLVTPPPQVALSS